MILSFGTAVLSPFLISPLVWLPHLNHSGIFVAWRGSRFSSSPAPLGKVLSAEVPMGTSACLIHMALAGTPAKPAPTLSCPSADWFRKLQGSVHRHPVFQKPLVLNSILKS